ncbi:MAG: HAD family hydrolase [Rhodobacteraceae bacterium]|nr:HAD family hydrolase [Paracoccaceae bacterium]
MKIKGILFDKDGTLFDFQRTWGWWFDQVISELSEGSETIKAELAESCGYDLAGQRFVSGSIIVIATAKEVNEALASCLPGKIAQDIDAIALRHLAGIPTFPVCDLHLLLQFLRKDGMSLGLATNDYHAGAEVQLNAAGIRDHFEFVCGYDSGYGGKPGSGMIEGFCNVTGLNPDQVAVVGDSAHDLQAGITANVALTIGVLTGPAVADELQPYASTVLTDISELPQFLGLHA